MKELDELLSKYYEGQSNEEEEKRLFSLLDTDALNEEYSEDQNVRKYFNQLKKTDAPMPSGMSSRLEALLDIQAEDQKAHQKKKRLFLRWAIGVAAMIAVVIGLAKGLNLPRNYIQTIDDPQLAYTYTVKALDKFSTAINDGYAKYEKANRLTKKFGKMLSISSK